METWLLRTTEFDGAHWQHSNSSIADPVLFSAGGTDGCAVRSRFVECSSRRGPRPRAILTPSVFFGRFLPAVGRIQRKESFFGTPASRGLMGRYPYYYGLLSPRSESGPGVRRKKSVEYGSDLRISGTTCLRFRCRSRRSMFPLHILGLP